MYSEIDDIRHRHSTYWDTYNNAGWIDPPDQQWSWNITRGMIVGGVGCFIGEICSFYKSQFKIIRTKYDPPGNLAQITSYFQLAGKLENVKFELKNRRQAAFLYGVDWMMRLLGYKFFVSGISQMYDAANREYWRRVLPTMFSAVLTSILIAPIAASKAAFRADQTFPKELQIGYSSIINTMGRLLRENPTYLFKNTIPFVFGSFIQTSILLSVFEFNMEVLKPVYSDGVGGSRFMVKVYAATFAAYAASVFSYPVIVSVRNAIHLMPKQISEDLFKGSYRKALWFYWNSEMWSQAWIGFIKSGFFYKTFPQLFSIIWLADTFGYFHGPQADFTRMPGSNSYGTFQM